MKQLSKSTYPKVPHIASFCLCTAPWLGSGCSSVLGYRQQTIKMGPWDGSNFLLNLKLLMIWSPVRHKAIIIGYMQHQHSWLPPVDSWKVLPQDGQVSGDGRSVLIAGTLEHRVEIFLAAELKENLRIGSHSQWYIMSKLNPKHLLTPCAQEGHSVKGYNTHPISV